MIYSIEGSEDGLVLCTTSLRRASNRAGEYVGINPKEIQKSIKLALERGAGVLFFDGLGVSVTVMFWD